MTETDEDRGRGGVGMGCKSEAFPQTRHKPTPLSLSPASTTSQATAIPRKRLDSLREIQKVFKSEETEKHSKTWGGNL